MTGVVLVRRYFMESLGEYDTRRSLANAAQQAKERNYDDYLIVDVDAHHYENECWKEIVEYIDNPIIKHMAQGIMKKGGGRPGLVPSQLGNQDMGGRIVRYHLRRTEKTDESVHREVALVRRYMDAIGIDYTILFPTPMLNLGLHPQVEVEAAVARAYARWITEKVLNCDPSIKSMLYLPFNDPDAALRLIDEFADKPGVVGFMVTSVRYKPVHDKTFMKIYAKLEELEMPLGFHAGYNWVGDKSMEQLNRFISVHALGFVFYNMLHITNWIINGIPERFPRLKVIWIESGLAWIPFLMQRLDHEFMMRSSEAPLLKRKPSEYMREFYYTSQPMERPENIHVLQTTFEMINAETQLLYSSDYPHWDFDLPSVIFDLPFLSEQAKRNILGENAKRLFKL